MRLRGWWALALVGGCGPIEAEADYVDARAAAECIQVERCELGFFESEYRDREDCQSERADDIDDLNDNQDERGCEYVPEEAGHCVRRIRAFNCEDWAEGESSSACDLVWNCLEA